MVDSVEWWVQERAELPDWFLAIVWQQLLGDRAGTDRAGTDRAGANQAGQHAAQLLWQLGIRDPDELAGFLNPQQYQPSSPFAFGEAMQQAVDRLVKAQQQGERVVIWGDFDADGIAATAVLWEGLGQFFPVDPCGNGKADRLTYCIPNRLSQPHGLSVAGIDSLDCTLIITADTGSTNAIEIAAAHRRGIDVIVIDHHTLTDECPPAIAFLNPRILPADHPFAQFSGVALTYKLVEAMYETLPDLPQRPLEDLLDLVAIGLIADRVALKGDCRYLAQLGIAQLQKTERPGLVKLLELCKRSGDRPTDISFGVGTRINAISRIYGDARFCIELLTSRDVMRCKQLAEETELANTRRKSLQKDMAQDVKAQIAQMDLSTTRAIVLSDSQWSVGVLGLVAAQMVREYGRPVILLSLEHLTSTPGEARGAASSPEAIDLYALFQAQSHLLSNFGGHPLALDLSLPVERIELFAAALNQQLREQQPPSLTELRADLTVTVTELGQELFRELKLLEPYGLGNPVPRLLIQNCWFEKIWHRNLEDWRGRKVRYIKTEFELWDEGTLLGFPGVWWEHYRDEILPGRCDAIVELDFNPVKKRYEIRLIALRPTRTLAPSIQLDWLLDERGLTRPTAPNTLPLKECPSAWGELQTLFREAVQTQQNLAIAYPPPVSDSPAKIWQTLVGIAKYLSRTGKTVTAQEIAQKLGVSDRVLRLGLQTLAPIGFIVDQSDSQIQVRRMEAAETAIELRDSPEVTQFLELVQEEQFRRRYFYEVPLTTIQAVAYQSIRGLIE
jgi:single-stranded-DNA-specific exonuclease